MTPASPTEQLRKHWESFAAGEEPTPLLAFLADHREFTRSCEHEFPSLHRIADLRLDGRLFRLTRCAECDERLTFVPIDGDIAIQEEAGVPYWLTGEALARWVDDERAAPSKGPVDWEAYKE